MNWLCRIIGHKWITIERLHMDGMDIPQVHFWPGCLRCGKPQPYGDSVAVEDVCDHRKEDR